MPPRQRPRCRSDSICINRRLRRSERARAKSARSRSYFPLARRSSQPGLAPARRNRRASGDPVQHAARAINRDGATLCLPSVERALESAIEGSSPPALRPPTRLGSDKLKKRVDLWQRGELGYGRGLNSNLSLGHLVHPGPANWLNSRRNSAWHMVAWFHNLRG